jgi:hypothetical protein
MPAIWRAFLRFRCSRANVRWRIPETKNGEPHEVPLSRQAAELLHSLMPTSENGQPIQPDPVALIFATSTGAALGNWDRETKAIHTVSGTEGWTRHDLRQRQQCRRC